MYLPFMRRYSWEQVINEVLAQPKHTDIVVEKYRVPPVPSDFKSRPADDDVQIADYGLALEDDTGIHIKEYDDCYKVHWDTKDPSVDPLGHLFYDSPKWLVVGAVALDWIVLKGTFTKKLLNFLLK